MKHATLQAAVLATLGLVSAQAMATGFVTLPSSGGSSAYVECNATGGYGQTDTTPPDPNDAATNVCALFSSTSPQTVNSSGTPAGYIQVASTTRNIVMNNSYTGYANKTVGTLTDRVYRISGTNHYIFGFKYSHTDIDYDVNTAGTQYFEVNDIQKSGFNTGSTLDVAYYWSAAADEALFRAGRTSTAVMALPGDPLPDLTAAPYALTTVDFTTDTNFMDPYPDLTSLKDSSWMYVKVDANGYTTGTCAYTFKEMGQEGQPTIDVCVDGYIPN